MIPATDPEWDYSEIRDGYELSLLSTPAPEYYTGEVVLGSAYRSLLTGVSEGKVDLERIRELPQRLSLGTSIPEAVWDRLVLGGVDGLSSPQPRGRSSRGYSLPQLAPVVPSAASHGCVMGKIRSRANPSNLLFVTLLRGLGATGARAMVEDLRMALRVGPTDDLFARFVEQGLSTVPSSDASAAAPAPGQLSDEAERYYRAAGDRAAPSPVAAAFARDLRIVLALKERLTRRQWTVLIETLLRLGLGTQVLWTCRANEAVWRLALNTLETGAIPDSAHVESEVWGASVELDPLFEAGPGAGPATRRRIGRYVQARVGLNSLLRGLEVARVPWSGPPIGIPDPAKIGESSAEAICLFLDHVSRHRTSIKIDPVADISAVPGSLVSCKRGFSKNMAEFIIYGLGQLAPADVEFQGYDQSFVLGKRGSTTRQVKVDRTRWVVRLGPSALVALVHACCRSLTAYSATMDDLRRHLASYGIRADAAQLKTGLLGQELRRLGLVVDSPDAGGGRLLVDPLG